MKTFRFLLVVQKNLEVGEVLSVDISCIVALTTTIDVQIKYNGPVRRAVFGVRVLYVYCVCFWLSISSLRWPCNKLDFWGSYIRKSQILLLERHYMLCFFQIMTIEPCFL